MSEAVSRVDSKSFSVFDCDAHVTDPGSIWDYIPEGERELVRDHGYWLDEDYVGLSILNGDQLGMTGHNVVIGASHSGAGMTPSTTRALKLMNPSEEQLREIEARGAFDPYSRLDEMDVCGIDQVLVIPTTLNAYFPFIDNFYAARALARAYNDWAADYCAADPVRLHGAALIPVQQGLMAADEVYRAAEKGFKVALLRPIDSNGRYPTGVGLEPFWQACEETGLVVGMHTFPAWLSGTYPWNEARHVAFGSELVCTQHSPGELIERAVSSSGCYQGVNSADLGFIWEAMTWVNGVLLSGFLDRHPKLRMAIFESNATWLPFLLNDADRLCKLMTRERQTKLERLPSEAFRDQMFIAFEGDETPVFRMWEYFKDIAIWSSDHYHHDARDAWTAIDEMNSCGVPVEVQAQLMGGNARRAYGIEASTHVTERKPVEHPAWWPTEDDIRNASNINSGGGTGGTPMLPLHKRPDQFMPYHRKKPLERL